MKEGSYAFVIDGDEIAVGDVKRAMDFMRESEAKIGWVDLKEEGNPGLKPRFLRVENGLHYARKHWELYDKDETLVTDSVYGPAQQADPETNVVVPYMHIRNVGQSRAADSERAKARDDYRTVLAKANWIES